MFSKHVGVCVSNEAEVLAILGGLIFFSREYGGPLVMECDSFNPIA